MKKTNHLLDRIIVDEEKKKKQMEKRGSCMHASDRFCNDHAVRERNGQVLGRPDGTCSETGAAIRKFRSAQIKSTPSHMKDH